MPLILGAIFEKIILYVEKKDVRYIALTCQLLYGLYLVHRDTNLVSKTWRSSTLHMERNDMIDTIYSSFSRKRRNNKLSKSHIQVILNDLVLVASGIRTSCLVDCVFLSMEMVKTLLLDILMKKWPFHFKQIRAICIHDNVFFLNSPIFLKQKLYDRLYHFQNHFLINVGGRRSVPRLLLPVSFDTRKLLDQDINALCDNILGTYHTKEAGVVVKTRSESQFVCCPTALAGLILDYPVIYMVTTTADSTNRMKSRENCLSMRPLTLFQQVLTYHAKAEDTMLHLQKLCEFSLPQELYLSPDTIMKQPTLERFVCAYSRLQLARACLCTSDEITYDVQSSTQLLSHVAI